MEILPRIVVVDDDKVVREVLRATLEDLGPYAVQCAVDISNALTFVEMVPRPVLAIIDVKMPNGSGIELADSISIPVLLVTGDLALGERLKSEGRAVLLKPIHEETLLARVREQIAKADIARNVA